MRMVGWAWFLGLWTVGLALSCNNSGVNPDAGDTDGALDADLDPCAAAAPYWNDTWRVSLDSTPLTGSTPDVNLMDVWGSAADDVYVVGFKGTVLHYDGSAWTQMVTNTQEDLSGVWGYVIKDAAGAVIRRDVFAAGNNGTILRYEGVAWVPQRVINDPDPANPNPQPVTGNFHDIWGTPAPGVQPTDQPTVIAVGGEGLIARYEPALAEFREMREAVTFVDHNGVSRTSYLRWTPERLGGVFGSAADNFVAVGNNGTALVYNGTSWARQTITQYGGGQAFTTHLNGIWGRWASELFAVGLDGTVVLFNGNWQQLGCRTTDPDVDPCTVDDDCGQLGYCWSSGCICPVPTAYLRSTWGFGQTKCGEIIDGGSPDAGVQREDTSWIIFAGWNGSLLMARNGVVCPFGSITNNRLEGMWGTTPRGETERTLDGGTVVCDPVEVFISGVNGTIVRLSNPNGQ